MRTRDHRRAVSIRLLAWSAAAAALSAGLLACSSSTHLDPPGSGTTTTGAGGGSGGGTSTASTSTGTGGAPPVACHSNSDCPYPTAICDTISGECRQCLVDADCSGATVCSKGSCVCPKATDSACAKNATQDARCVDLASAQNDCGACGHACYGACNASKCADPWEPTAAAGAPEGRSHHVAVWDSTDKVMIVWGGRNGGSAFNTGGVYDPAKGTWTPTSLANAPSPRFDATAVWDDTDKAMIVWGGRTPSNVPLATGGIYYPAKNVWKAISNVSTLSARWGHTAVWTGTRMIVWGGTDGTTPDGDGASFDPAANAWTQNVGPFLTGRSDHTAIWTGSSMVIWGGFGTDGVTNNIYLGDGAAFDLSSWTALMGTAPSNRARHTAAWTGMSMVVWGGADAMGQLNDGSKYQSNSGWLPTNNPAPSAREGHTAVWIKTASTSQMLVWGGVGPAGYVDEGFSLDETTLNWTGPLPTAPAPRAHHTAVINGSQMIVWGGDTSGGVTNSGAVFDASTIM